MASDTPAIRRSGLRLKTSARFLLRSIGLRGASFLLALLAITVGATVTATMLNLKSDLHAKMSKELRAYGPNLILTPRSGEPGSTLDESPVRRLPRAAPMLLAAGSLAPAGGSTPSRVSRASATLVGCDFETLRLLYPSWRVDGAWPAGRPGSVCLVGASLAARAGLREGSPVSLRIGGREITAAIAGIVSTGEAEDDEVFLPLPLLQEATGRPGRVSLAVLAIDGGMIAVTTAGRAAESAVPGSSARPLRPIAAAQGALLGKLDRMMVLLTAVVLLISGLCLVTTLMSMVVERESEIGILRSMGAKDGEIFMMFCGEVGLLGLLGALAGLAFGALGARSIGRHLFGAAIEARAATVPAVLAVSLGLCLLAVLLPLRRALAVQPAAVLRGE